MVVVPAPLLTNELRLMVVVVFSSVEPRLGDAAVNALADKFDVVQDDRLEGLVVGWGLGEESWLKEAGKNSRVLRYTFASGVARTAP